MAVGTPTTGSGNSATPALTKPSVSVGDAVLASISLDFVSNVITLTGFTQLAQGNITGPDGHRYYVGWRRIDGTEGATFAASFGSGAGKYLYTMIPLTGRHAVNPPVAGAVTTSIAANASPITITAPAVVAVAGDDILHFVLPDVNADDIGSGFTAWALGAEIVDIEGPAGVGNLWCNLGVAKAENVAAGSTGTKATTFSLTSGAAGYATLLVRVPAAPGGAITVVLGQLTETDTPQPITKQKFKTVGQASEADTTQPVARAHLRALGQVSEADTTFTIARLKLKVLGSAQETDQVFTIARAGTKTIVLGLIVETDTAQVFSRLKLKTLGSSSEVDSVFTPVRRKTRTSSQLAETDLLQPVTAVSGAKRRTLGLLSDAEVLNAVQGFKVLSPVDAGSRPRYHLTRAPYSSTIRRRAR